MIIVAGPPGSGKSTVFPVSTFGIESFNADDRAAELNGASYLQIPGSIRSQVNAEFEKFIADHIAARRSFAFETTLRSSITFDQVLAAKAAGFTTEMRYLALHDFAMHLKRIQIRADGGGHSAPQSVLRAIYESSLLNLSRAVQSVDRVSIYDNSSDRPVLLLETAAAAIVYRRGSFPSWLRTALSQ